MPPLQHLHDLGEIAYLVPFSLKLEILLSIHDHVLVQALQPARIINQESGIELQ
jgi:hypothetical protein